MPLLLPNLDDRTWADLVDEGRALIPVYGPEWTDQNYHDPGITLIELLAWIAEMDIYQLNQISDRERLKFLALVGVAPKPPLPARVVLSLGLVSGSAPVTLPAGLELVGNDPFDVATRYRTLDEITVASGSLNALQFRDASGYQNLTPAWRRRAVVNPFGSTPQPGAELYLGLCAALPVDTPVKFYFTFADSHSGPGERHRLVEEARAMEKRCRPPLSENPCGRTGSASNTTTAPQAETPCSPPMHYGVRTVWEYYLGGTTQWLPLDASKDEVVDDTRAFTLDGTVTFRLPGVMALNTIGAVATSCYYLRCRFEAGSYDAAPALRDIAFNGIGAEQAVPSGMSFVIDPKATIVYTPPQGLPKPNDQTALQLELDSSNKATKLTFGGASTDPQFRILDYRAPSSPTPGVLCIEAVFLGFGNGFPSQEVTLLDAPVDQSSVKLYTLEKDAWHTWELRADFDSSTRKDLHAVLDPTTGTVTFGNGEKGRTPRDKSLIVAVYRATRAQAGNLAAGAITNLADSPHNRAILYDPTTDGFAKLKSQLGSVTNALAAVGGAAAETVAQAAGRADQLVESSGRAVTLADYERLAVTTPGTRIARVTAVANLHPSFPCYSAPGMIAVIVLPYLLQGRPVPTPGLLRAVTAYLRPRRVIGTRVAVVGPTYLEVAIQASVQSKAGINKANLQQAIVEGLNNFLDPLIGGPDGTGWPFGRDVYRSEIMKVIAGVAGVDFIVSLELIAEGCQPQCGNVCLGATWLVAAGAHQITVL